MGMQTSGKGRGSLNEINVTPLVDVMLVLLVVFMITTPMIVEEAKQRQVDVDLPKTNANQPVKPSEMNTIISLKADFKVELDTGAGESSPLVDCTTAATSGDFAACLAELEPKLAANPKLQELDRIYLLADRKLPYGFVVDVMARLRNAGLVNIGMVTNPQDGSSG